MDKKERKALADQLALSIAYVLKKTNEKAAQKIHKHIADAAKQLVKRMAKQMPDTKVKSSGPAKKTGSNASVKQNRLVKKTTAAKPVRKSSTSRPAKKS